MWNRVTGSLERKRQKRQQLKRRLRSALGIEALEPRRLLAYTVFTNPLQPLNVSGDSQEAVSPLDALLVINELNSRRYTNPSDAKLPVYSTPPAARLPYLDVSCDGAVTPFDALLVINSLNTHVVPVSLTFDVNGGDGVAQLTSVDCRPQLNEGTAFTSTLKTSFIVPPGIRSLRIGFADLNFDTTTKNSIRDSFEIALVDEQGSTVVLPFEAKRDALLNVSEEQSPLLGANAQLASGTIDVDLQQLPPATKANLVIRLINNDADAKTSVRITKFELRAEALTTPTAATLATPPVRANVGPIDFSNLEDVSSSIMPSYGRTALVQQDGLLHTELLLTNSGTYAIDGPVIAVIDQLSDPQVQVRDADGITSDGKPYLVMLDGAAASTLPAGTSTATRRLAFHNPNSGTFTYRLTTLAAVNRAPVFTGEPVTEVKAGGQYRYAFTAVDPDGDALSYRLLYGPKNMSLTGNVLTWNPTLDDAGNHTLGLQVSDGRGGRTDLAYQLLVTTGVPNRPPVITSTPVVDANVGTAYQYLISASDADGDGLVFRLVEGAAGMQLDANTGRLTWSPDAADAEASGQATQTAFGTQPVTVSVEDGQGGSARQSFILAVDPVRGNHQPVIISTAPSAVASTGPLDLRPGFMSQVIATLNPQYTISGLALGPEGTLIHGSLQGPIVQRNLATGQVVTLKSSGLSSSARMVVANGGGFGTDLLHVDFNAEPGLNCCRGTIYRTNRTTGQSSVLYVGALNRTAGDAFGVALGNGGAFGNDLYVMDFQGISDGAPLLERITPTGAISVFAEGGPWTQQTEPTHIEFSPGGQFGEFLYVADSESQKIWKVSPTGAISEFPLSEPLKPRVIRFAKGGAFGDFLYAAEATGRIVRIAADGSVTPFLQVDAGATEHSPFTGDMVFDPAGERLYIGLDNRILEVLPSDQSGFQYDVRALDADADPLSYEVISGPQGIVIDQQTGCLRWYPSDAQSGKHTVVVRVKDGNGGLDSQTFSIDVQSLGRAEIRGQVRAGADVAGATGRGGIDVFLDQNENGLRDDGELSAISDDQGNYAFHGLLPGLYVVAQALEPGLKLVQPAGGSYEVIAAGGQTIADRNFVNVVSTVAEIGGVNFHDLNADGMRTYSAVKVVVPGTANPWLAGLPDGATAAYGDKAPQQSPVQARLRSLTPGLAVMFDVSGSVSYESGPQGTDPDGARSYFVAHSAGNENGFGNSVMPVNSLVGVFLSDELPTASPAPSSLDFLPTGNVTGGVNYTSLSPRLKQPFFIGDGRTSSGQRQQVIVPAGATRLYLGIQDGIGWFNNWGTFDVTVTAQSEPGLKNWTMYVDENGNDRLDAGERSVFTDKDGHYAFTDLAPGSYKVSETLVRYYDAAADFSFTDNPNSPWSYGYTTTRGTEFQLSTVKIESPTLELWSGTPNGPHIIHNRTGETIFGGITYPPDVLNLDPSYDGRNAVLRFTAPETDTYRIRGRFQGIDRTRGPSTDVAVLKNSQSIIEGTINGFFTDLASTPSAILNFDTVITAQAGDVIDFSVGHGPDDSLYDSTGVAAIISGSKTFGEGLWRQTAPAAGSHAITVSAGEVRDDLDFGNLKITQPPPESHGPRFISTPVTEIRTGQIYRYQSQATDTDGDSLTFGLAVAPAGMVIDPRTGLILWNPNRDQVGEHDVILRVRDTGGEVDIQAFRVTVTSGGGAPSITSNPPGPASAGLPYLYKLRAQDPDGDTLTYRLTSPALGNMSVDANKGWFSWRPTPGDVGPHSIQITATDATGLAISQTFVLSVVDAAINRNPTIESEPRLQAKLANGYLYAIDAFDPDGDPLVYEIVSAPRGLELDADGVVTWTPQPDQIGPNPVQVRVSDGRGGQQTQAFTVTVDAQSVNSVPSVTSAPLLNAALNVEYQYQVKAIDADGDTLAFALEKAPLGLSIDPLRGTLRWNPQVEQIGEQVVEVRVSDPAGASATQRFSVTVRSSQLAPQITSSPITTATVDRNYRYAVRATDPEGRGLRYTLVSSSGDMSIDGSGLLRWQPTAAELGQVNVVVRVTDEQGASTDQAFPITVSSTTTNRPPRITSTPILGATLQTLYQLQVTAEDPDGDALRFGFLEVPAGMTIDESSGLIRWTPDQAGIGRVTVLVQDAGGGDAEQSFEVVVGSTNTAPVITSRPEASISAGATYRYDVQARDTDADPLRIELQSGPAGMQIDNFGRISWLTSTADAGTHRVRVMASDGRGGSATQEFDLTVLVDSRAPVVYLAYESPVPLGSESTLAVRATDNTSVKSLSLTVDGVALPLDSKGRATVRLSRLGQIPIVATATDAAGNVGTQSANVLVIDTSITEAPRVSLDAPAEDASVTTLSDVIGSVSDPNLISWQLELVPLDEGQPRLLRQSNQPVAAAGLGQIDASLLQNGAYTLRLTAINAGGLQSVAERSIFIDGERKLGNFSLSFTDLSIPVAGIPITVVRNYSTLNASVDGELGYGWSLSYRDVDLRTSLSKTGDESGGLYTPFRDGTRVYVTLPGGQREGFTFRPKAVGLFDPYQRERDVGPEAQSGSGLRQLYFVPYFVPDKGVTSQLTVLRQKLFKQGHEYFQFGGGLPYNPADSTYGGSYTLSTKAGRTYRIDAELGSLTSVTDAAGDSLQFTDDRIESSTGAKVSFARDLQGRITTINDPMGGSIRYAYDATGNLESTTDRLGNKTTYFYLQSPRHFLDRYVDPLGNTGVKTNYDSSGRLTSVEDASGKPVSLTFDVTQGTETSQDPLGNRLTRQYDERGNIITIVDALGKVTRQSYDDNNNLLSITSALGFTAEFTYDSSGSVLSETNPLGETTLYTYDAAGRVLTTTRPDGATFTTAYNNIGRPVATTDPLGNVLRATYDTAGRLLTQTDSSGATSSFAYDNLGRVASATDALGRVRSFTYDANGNRLSESQVVTTPSGPVTVKTETIYDAQGRPTKVTGPDGTTKLFEYDSLGHLTAETNQLGQRTVRSYNASGQLVSSVLPDGRMTKTGYDAVGRVQSSLDEDGQTTKYVYDPVGNIIETLFPDDTPADDSDNPRIRYDYDAVGQLIAETDAFGNRTEFTYDAAGNQIRVRDALGNVTTSKFNPLGIKIAETDALGRTTSYVLDELGRTTQTIFADGTRLQTVYRQSNGQHVVGPGSVSATIDEEGHTTRFSYDVGGHLIAVEDPMGGTMRYAYNDLGQMISERNALGQETKYETNLRGLRTATILPLGQRATQTYDAASQLVTSTNFNGQSINYAYDVDGQLVRKTLPDSSSVTFSYNAQHMLESVTDARGRTLTSYDGAGQIVSVTQPDGQVISYEYDRAGRRTAVITAAGKTSSTYDALDRLSTVTAPDGGVTRYAYDAVGNLVRTELPNGTVERRTYDARDRLLSIQLSGAAGLLSGFRYSYSKSGQRLTSVDLVNSQTVAYSYDALGRLVRETTSDSTGELRRITYTYDAAGNRLERNDSIDGLTQYQYDGNGRLTQSTHNGEVTQYTYDSNGNELTRVTGASRAVTSHWDAENRLIASEVTVNGHTQQFTYSYDAAGNRVSRSVDGAITRFLVDTQSQLPQVLMETTPSGQVIAAYVRGHGLISEQRGGTTSFYAVDGLGSTVAIVGADGLVARRMAYDSFGRLLTTADGLGSYFGYAGEQTDMPLGWSYLRARYYDADLGRFVSRDSFDGFEGDPLSREKYLYGEGDPVNNVDPTGHIALPVIAGGVGLLATISVIYLGVKFKQASAGVLVAEGHESTVGAVSQQAAAWVRNMNSAGRDVVEYFFGSVNTSQRAQIRKNWTTIGNAISETALGTVTIKSVNFREFESQLKENVPADTLPRILGIIPAVVRFYPLFWDLPKMPEGRTQADVMVHELTHALLDTTDSRSIIFSATYGVRAARKLTPAKAIQNADNYALEALYRNAVDEYKKRTEDSGPSPS